MSPPTAAWDPAPLAGAPAAPDFCWVLLRSNSFCWQSGGDSGKFWQGRGTKQFFSTSWVTQGAASPGSAASSPLAPSPAQQSTEGCCELARASVGQAASEGPGEAQPRKDDSTLMLLQ